MWPFTSSSTTPSPPTQQYFPTITPWPSTRVSAHQTSSSAISSPSSQIDKAAQLQDTSLSPKSRPDNSLSTARGRRQAGVFFGGVAFVLWSGLMTRRSMTKRRDMPSVVQMGPGGVSGQVWHGEGAAIGRELGNSGSGVLMEGQGQAPGYKPAVLESEGAAQHSQRAGPTPGRGQAPNAAADEAAAADLNNSGPILALEALFLASANVVSWGLMVTGGALWGLNIGSMDELRRMIRGGLGVDGTGRTEQEAEEEVEEWLARVLRRGEDKAVTRQDAKGRERL